ncbi:hypothetical protein EI94DRAFT_1745319 [Lactarius quietus]|nr:hypothetical protein EI94DRAFT_1745319 [Lactarius quietus]
MISAVNDVTSAYILNFVFSKVPSVVRPFQSSLSYEIVSRLSRLDDRCHQTQLAPETLQRPVYAVAIKLFREAESSNRKTNQHSGAQGPRTRESAEEMVKSIIDDQENSGDLMQADLYFQSAAGYGQWRILAHALWKKLVHSQELSLGYFSETNQKRLTRDSPIDIIEPYLIDVVPEFGRDVSSVAKILL